MRRRYLVLFVFLLVTAGIALPQAGANHRFFGHWKTNGGPINVHFVDSATDSWDGVMQAAANEWSESNVLDVVIDPGNSDRTTRRRCRPVPDAVRICNFNYGGTGWVGLTTAVVRGKHFVRASIRLNSTYLGKHNRKVMCHEMGHGLGLGHRSDAGSCMKQGTASQHPDRHDYRMLNRIYSHAHSVLADSDAGEQERVIQIATPVDAR